jgi:hypothetical protein
VSQEVAFTSSFPGRRCSSLFSIFFFAKKTSSKKMVEAGCLCSGLAFCGVRGGLSVLPPTTCLAVDSPPRAGRARFALMMCDGSRETAEEAALRRGGGRGTKGLYVRPSKALEVGGGFYVPGLEGYRLRVAIVGLVLTLLTLNRLLLPGFKPQTTQVRVLAMPSQSTGLCLPLRLFSRSSQMPMSTCGPGVHSCCADPSITKGKQTS